MLGTWALMVSLTLLGLIAAWVPLRSAAIPESSRLACVAAAIFLWFLAGAMLADLVGSAFSAELLRLLAAISSMGAAFATLVLRRHYAELEEKAEAEKEQARKAAATRRKAEREQRFQATEHTLTAIQNLWGAADAIHALEAQRRCEPAPEPVTNGVGLIVAPPEAAPVATVPHERD